MKQAEFDCSKPRADGDLAAGMCADKAEREGFDLEGAREFVIRWLQLYGHASGETLVNACKAAGLVPHDDRAFGAVFAVLARRKLIRCVSLTLRSKGHGTAGGRIWEAI